MGRVKPFIYFFTIYYLVHILSNIYLLLYFINSFLLQVEKARGIHFLHIYLKQVIYFRGKCVVGNNGIRTILLPVLPVLY